MTMDFRALSKAQVNFALRLSSISLFVALLAQDVGAGVSSARQTCIRNAMAAGSAALGNAAQLNRLFERYFAGEKIAQLAAGNDWKRYNEAQRDAQRERVRRFVVEVLAPNISYYKSSRINFVSENGGKVKGIVTGPHGERRTVTWHFAGPCKFINVGIAGYGTLIGLVGKGKQRP
jgi:MlaC protein